MVETILKSHGSKKIANKFYCYQGVTLKLYLAGLEPIAQDIRLATNRGGALRVTMPRGFCFFVEKIFFISKFFFEIVLQRAFNEVDLNHQVHHSCKMTSSPVKPSTKSATIDDLPAEMIFELFKHLSLKDLTACSMVNRRWHSIHADFRVDSLVVSCKPGYIYINKWGYPGRKIADDVWCHPELFLHFADKPLLANLKYLSLGGNTPKLFKFDLNELNKFSQLIALEINIYFQVKETEDVEEAELVSSEVNLYLPKLKVLAFHCHRWNLSVDCPVLSSLVYKNESEGRFHLVVKQPETIRKLETTLIGANLSPFQGVECLVTENFEEINRYILGVLPNLKELHFKGNILCVLHSSEYLNQVGSVRRLKKMLSEFLDDLQRLRGPDFRFTFAGLQLTEWTLEQIDFGVKNCWGFERVFNEHLYLKNQHLIDPDVSLDFVSSFDYSRLMHFAAEEIPSWFFERFSHISNISISDPVRDVDHFGWFLSSLSSLSGLDLYRAWLDQDFYDQLPSLAPQLRCLSLSECSRNELRLKFDFVAKLPDLSTLRIGQDLSPESVASLMSVFSKLEKGYFSFKLRGNQVYISKHQGSNLYELTGNFNRETSFTTESSDEVLDYLNKLPAYRDPDTKKSRTRLGSQALSSYLSQSADWLRSFLTN